MNRKVIANFLAHMPFGQGHTKICPLANETGFKKILLWEADISIFPSYFSPGKFNLEASCACEKKARHHEEYLPGNANDLILFSGTGYSAVTNRNLPARSVTRASPCGRKAMDHGTSSPVTTVSVLISTVPAGFPATH